MSARQLIVNADDFGLSAGVNRGIAQAHEHGVVTSASLMVRAGHAPAAAAYARLHPELSVGLHVDLGEWHYTGELWVATYTVVDPEDGAAVEGEVSAQLERFCALLGRPPTHLDGHQHVQRQDPARTVVLEHAARWGVPVRDLAPAIRHEGGFYGQDRHGQPWPQGIDPQALCALLRALPPGITELGCHPGLDDESGSSYAQERTVETATLCHPVVLATVAELQIELVSYAEL